MHGISSRRPTLDGGPRPRRRAVRRAHSQSELRGERRPGDGQDASRSALPDRRRGERALRQPRRASRGDRAERRGGRSRHRRRHLPRPEPGRRGVRRPAGVRRVHPRRRRGVVVAVGHRRGGSRRRADPDVRRPDVGTAAPRARHLPAPPAGLLAPPFPPRAGGDALFHHAVDVGRPRRRPPVPQRRVARTHPGRRGTAASCHEVPGVTDAGRDPQRPHHRRGDDRLPGVDSGRPRRRLPRRDHIDRTPRTGPAAGRRADQGDRRHHQRAERGRQDDARGAR